MLKLTGHDKARTADAVSCVAPAVFDAYEKVVCVDPDDNDDKVDPLRVEMPMYTENAIAPVFAVALEPPDKPNKASIRLPVTGLSMATYCTDNDAFPGAEIAANCAWGQMDRVIDTDPGTPIEMVDPLTDTDTCPVPEMDEIAGAESCTEPLLNPTLCAP